jgi:hypothetical protein
MKRLDFFTKLDLFINVISLLIAIGAGLLNQRLISMIAIAILVISWMAWVSVSIIRLRLGSNDQRDLPSSTAKYLPEYRFLQNEPVLIDDLKRQVKMPPIFLAWPRFTLLFWVNINDEFLSSKSNRYLFCYTSNSSSEIDPKYPNGFFLGLLGDTMKWRFVLKGPDPHNATEMNFRTSDELRGWKLVAIRWRASTHDMVLSIDAGKVFIDRRSVNKLSMPVPVHNQILYLGGWGDSWAGGLSKLNFYDFRIYKEIIDDRDLVELHKQELSHIQKI